MLRQILAEEVTHVSAGMRWFREICAADADCDTPIIEVSAGGHAKRFGRRKAPHCLTAT